jgi:hypothetical protein
MTEIRKETDSLGEVDVPADKLWGAQTQRSLEHFSIGQDLIPREMITAYAILKKGAAIANFAGKRLDKKRHDLIVQVCDEVLAGQHHDMFPLQHECERGDRQPLQPDRRHSAGKQDPSPPKRSCEYGSVVERLLSVGHEYRGRPKRETAADPSGATVA